MECKENLLDNCDGFKLITLISSLSSVLAKNLSLDDQNLFGNILLGTGQGLLIIAAQNTKYQNCIQACKDNNTPA